MPAVVCGLVGVIIGAVMQTGMGIKLSGVLIGVSAGDLYILLCLTAVCCCILGMGLRLNFIYYPAGCDCCIRRLCDQWRQ